MSQRRRHGSDLRGAERARALGLRAVIPLVIATVLLVAPPTVLAAPLNALEAVQGSNGDLWTVDVSGQSQDWNFGMMAGTSPSITDVPGSGWEIAAQDTNGYLWDIGTAEVKKWNFGMAAGSSPSITGLPTGGFEIAAVANTGDLWTIGSAGIKDWNFGMMAGTSPSITGRGNGGYEVAAQDNNGYLWEIGTSTKQWNFGMAPGSSPSITGLPSGGFAIAAVANTGELWTFVSNGSVHDWGVKVAPGTSPSIAAYENLNLDDAWEVAFQSASTGTVWTLDSNPLATDNGRAIDTGGGILPGTSPSITFAAAGVEAAVGPALAWNANDLTNLGQLPTRGGLVNTGVSMAPGTSPSMIPEFAIVDYNPAFLCGPVGPNPNAGFNC